MNNLYNIVENILQKYNLEDKALWAKSLINSHLIGGRLHSHLNVSIAKATSATKRYFPKKESGTKVLIYILKEENLKLCKSCTSIKSLDSFSTNNSNCKECHNQQQSRYYYRNSEEQIQRVRQRERKLDRQLSYEEIQLIFYNFNSQCANCGYNNEQHNIDWGMNLHIDHIIPFSKGGLTTVENSQLLCISCNTSKGNKLLP